MDKLLLKLVAVFRNVFSSQGVDYEKMIAIVETKLTMDKRRVFVHWKQNQQQSEKSNRLVGVLIFYGFMGCFIGLLTFVIPSVIVSMIMLHTYVMVMMAMTLITDFSTVLLDTTDNQVLLPKPVDGKTLFMARLVHILIYILQFSIALALAPLIMVFISYGGLAGAAAIFTILLTVLMAVFFSYLIYLGIITFASENKVKDIITYLQVFMIILFSLSFQVLPRLIDVSDQMITFRPSTWAYVFPPVWMALVIEAVHTLHFDLLHIGMAVLAVVVPLSAIFIMNKWLAPLFSSRLAAINTDAASKPDEATVQTHKKPLSFTLSRLLCRGTVERASFEMTWKMTARDKFFKLQFYPSLGYIGIYIFLFVFKSKSSLTQTLHDLSSTNMFLWFIYMPVFAVSSGMIAIGFSEQYLAAWVYHSSPVQRPGELIAGAVKALFTKFFIPVFTILLFVCIYLWGVQIIDDFIFGFFNSFFCCVLFASLAEYYLPFSRQPNTQQQSGRFFVVIVQLLAIVALVGLHYLVIVYSFQWSLLVLIPLLALSGRVLLKRLTNIGWHQIHV